MPRAERSISAMALLEFARNRRADRTFPNGHSERHTEHSGGPGPARYTYGCHDPPSLSGKAAGNRPPLFLLGREIALGLLR
jgi:hypothetical protein